MAFINDIIKIKREELNLTQEELAEKIGVTRQAISKWELNKNLPDVYSIKKLAEVFNMDANDLIGVEKENKKVEKNVKKVNKKPILIFCSICALIYIALAVFIICPIIKNKIDELNKPELTVTFKSWSLKEYEKFDTIKTYISVTNNTDKTIKVTHAYLIMTDEEGNIVLECNDMVPGWKIEANETINPTWTASYGFDKNFFETYLGKINASYKFDYYYLE